MKLSSTTVEIDHKRSFTIYHNIPDLIEAAIANWEVRTNKYTAQSLCDYINSKREAGMTDHHAFTEKQIKDLNLIPAL